MTPATLFCGRYPVVRRLGSGGTVRVRTVATHTDRVDRCTGTLQTARSGGRWVVEPHGLSCTRGY